jgi:tyrosinase
MANQNLQSEVDQLLSGSSAKATEAAPVLMRSVAAAAEPEATFTAFDDEHLDRALALMRDLIGIAESQGLVAAVQAAQQLAQTETLHGVTQYALKLFMTHYPPARQQLRFRPLEQRQPNLAVSSAAAPMLKGTAMLNAPYPSAATPPEDKVSFWREDPLLNEHHEHWHLVYPAGDAKPGYRRGELFAYMHEQMIARYDSERLALGLPRLEALPVNADPIPQGYNPGDLRLWDGSQWMSYRARPAGAAMSDLQYPFATRPGATLAQQKAFLDALRAAATSGSYASGEAVTPDNLGDTTEASSLSTNRPTCGNVHNDGHIHLMYYDNTMPFGVMADTSTAVRDPVFFRWHKQVDNVFYTHQETLAANDFSNAPKVRVRSNDIFLISGGFPAADAAAALEGDRWDDDPLASGSNAFFDTLYTEMLTREIEVHDADGNPVKVPIDYVSHDDFKYALRIENLDEAAQSVAVRIFLAPESEVEHREMWIEMDKFVYQLAPKQRAVIIRKSEESSVVRKPALKPDDLTSSDEPDLETEQSTWCDCGWPYTMLVPRGTKEGMPYRIFVMLSFGNEITVPPAQCCSSVSYCGLEDKPYPDTMAMGFPFDRPFPKGVMATIAKQANMATRPIKIVWK